MAYRFYLSTRKDRSEEGARISRALVEHGWECTFDWTAIGDSEHPDFPGVAQGEIEGIQQANVLIVLLPGGFGTHVEIGAALAFGELIIIHSPSQTVLETPYPCVFHYHPMVNRIVSECVDIDAVLDLLPS